MEMVHFVQLRGRRGGSACLGNANAASKDLYLAVFR